MKLTKHEHACVILEKNSGAKIIIDPGVFSNLPDDLTNTEAVVITHKHADHFDRENIDKILNSSPDAKVFSTSDLDAKGLDVTIPNTESVYKTASFSLNFYGGEHAIILGSIPIINNLGVCIDELVAYPGDSFSVYNKHVKYLLTPAIAPWLKSSEVVKFIEQSSADIIIPTHDALLSETGKNTYYSHYRNAANQTSKEFTVLKTGQSIDIKK